MYHFNNLTPAQLESLSLTMEECGEVVQIIGKIQRHGIDSYHPDSKRVNRVELAKECGDVECAIAILIREGILTREAIDNAKQVKIDKFRERPELLHHIDPL